MNNSPILVTYASAFGTTAEVAEAVAEALCDGGATVDVGRVSEVTELAKYDAVVVGSPIQYDRWMAEARDFVVANEDELTQVPVAYFFTCLTLSKRSAKTEAKALRYVDDLVSLSSKVTPLSVGRFAGVLDYSHMPWYARLPARAIMTVMGVKEADYRDWDAIRSWGDSLCPVLA